MPETATEKCIDKIKASEKRRLQNFRKLKEQIRNDESLPELDRAVLGATGSVEELNKYKEIALKIGQLAGQPIIRIERTSQGKVMEANAGLIGGPLDSSLNYWSGILGDEKRRFSSSILRVPLSSSVAYLRKYKDSTYPGRGEKEMFFDEQNSMYDRDAKISYMDVARITPIPEYEHRYKEITEPSQDYEHQIPPSSVLIGREAIYGSEYFQGGIDNVLLALEGYSSQEENRPNLRLAS